MKCGSCSSSDSHAEGSRFCKEQQLTDIMLIDAWEDMHPTIGTIRIERRGCAFVALINDDFRETIELFALTRAGARAKAATWISETTKVSMENQ